MANNGNWLQRSAYLPIMRKHVQEGSLWAVQAGTDYWLTPTPGYDQGQAGSATDPRAIHALAEVGWTATSLVNTAGSGGDFGSAADVGVPNHFLTDLTGDKLESPSIFGDYAHMRMAQDIAFMASIPRYLIAEFWGAMTVHTADEPTSGWGFAEDGGAIETAADQIAFISSDGTNFQISANASTPVNGAADDANWHLFKIALDRIDAVVRWYIDGTLQAGTPAITADEFPCSFGFHALTTNRPGLGLTHVYYDWS